MKDTIANKIASFVATLEIADKPEFIRLWQNQPPQAFNDAIAAVRVSVADVQRKGAHQSASTKGAAVQLRDLRKAFQIQLHLLARATYQCLLAEKKIADAEKVNLTPSDLRNARGIALAGMGETVLELAEPLLAGSGKNHFTQAQVDTADSLWEQFGAAVGAPAGARSMRKALTEELPVDVRTVEAKFSVCDDYLPQFAVASEAGRQFSDAWFAARHVNDLGRRASKPDAPHSPTP